MRGQIMDIDKAFEKYTDELLGKDVYKMLSSKFRDSDYMIYKKKTFTAGAEYGTKQSRIDTLDDVKKIIKREQEAGVCCDGALLDYIDTELEELK